MSLPWYKWHAADWVRCETRFELTLAERGIYRDLLDLHYLEGSIPKNPRVLVGFLASPEEVETFKKSWEKISKLFQQHPSDPERLVNRRAVAMIQEQRKFQKTQRLNGSKGGRPKKTHGLANSNPTETHGLAKRKPSQSQSQSEVEEEETPYSSPLLDIAKPQLRLGEFGHVTVTEEEFAKLQQELGPLLQDYVDRFDGWVHENPNAKASGGKRKDRNPYLSIRAWFRKDKSEGRVKTNHGHSQDPNTDAIAEALRRRAARRADSQVAPVLRGTVSDVREHRDDGESRSLVRTSLGPEPF